METITSKDGTRLAYERRGAGAALVLVHGTGGSSARWKPLLPAFERDFSVYALDRRGRGESGDASEYALEREIEDVATFVDAIGEPVHLLGHSFGGLCALEASLRTRNLGGLILYEAPIPVEGVPTYPDELIEELEKLLEAGKREAVLATFMEQILRMPPAELAAFRNSPAWPVRVAAAHTLPRELRAQKQYRFAAERFKEMTTPTMLLVGGNSSAFFKASSELVNRSLPNCQICVLAGQQHNGMDTAPELFAREVSGFLKNEE